jgi:hypothetical protein
MSRDLAIISVLLVAAVLAAEVPATGISSSEVEVETSNATLPEASNGTVSESEIISQPHEQKDSTTKLINPHMEESSNTGLSPGTIVGLVLGGVGGGLLLMMACIFVLVQSHNPQLSRPARLRSAQRTKLSARGSGYKPYTLSHETTKLIYP